MRFFDTPRRPVRVAQCGVVLFFVGMAAPAISQVNTDGLRGDLDSDGVSGSIAGRMAGRTGNVESMTVGGAAHIQGLFRKHWGLLYTSADFERHNRVTVTEETFALANYGYQLYRRLMLEAYAQTQSDKFQLLQFRFVTGGGPRFGLILGPELFVYAATAYMYEHERLNIDADSAEPDTTNVHRWHNTLSAAYKVDDRTRMMFVTYLQPRFDRFQDFHLLQDASLSYNVAGGLEVSIVFSLLHDSEPPADLRKTNIQVKNQLRWKF